MRRRIFTGIILSLTAAISLAAPISGQGTWETTLQGRLPLTPGGTDYQAYYDTDLDITWLADANLAASQTFGLTRINANYIAPGEVGPTGEMQWGTANSWIAEMNAASYLDVSDWRLPTVTDTGEPGCDSGTDCWYNVDPTTGEMAHLFYSTLGNISPLDATGDPRECFGSSPPTCLFNDGPFSNLQPHEGEYWSGTTFAPAADYAWFFYFGSGIQLFENKGAVLYAWPVRHGDIAAVPVPAVGWLLAPVFGLLGYRKRRVLSN